MAYNEDFRALASILINEHVDVDLKNKAKTTMTKIIELMDKGVDIELNQVNKYISGIEVIKG